MPTDYRLSNKMNSLAIGLVAPLILCEQALAPKQQSTKLISRNGRAPHSRASSIAGARRSSWCGGARSSEEGVGLGAWRP